MIFANPQSSTPRESKTEILKDKAALYAQSAANSAEKFKSKAMSTLRSIQLKFKKKPSYL